MSTNISSLSFDATSLWLARLVLLMCLAGEFAWAVAPCVADEASPQAVEAKDDANGMAEVSVPKFVYEKLEIGEINWQVADENYVMFRDDRSIDDHEQPVVDQFGISRESDVDLRRGETTEVTIRMDRKGTKVIGE